MPSRNLLRNNHRIAIQQEIEKRGIHGGNTRMKALAEWTNVNVNLKFLPSFAVLLQPFHITPNNQAFQLAIQCAAETQLNLKLNTLSYSG